MIIAATLIWGLASVIALALVRANGTTEDERNDEGSPVTVWEVIRGSN